MNYPSSPPSLPSSFIALLSVIEFKEQLKNAMKSGKIIHKEAYLAALCKHFKLTPQYWSFRDARESP